MITIEKNIPVPEGPLVRKYPWKEMSVGDSFLLPAKNPHTNIIWANNRFRGERKFTTRKTAEGYRVWRIA